MGTVAGELPLADPTADADRARLQQLGYRQELKRVLSYVRAAGAGATLQLVRSFVLCRHR